MALVEMVMPKMGESIMEATVLSWLKQEGDTIEQDESVLEVATDKVDTEVPATHGGVLKEILAKEGDVVPVGNPIARIETEEEVAQGESTQDDPGGAEPAPEPTPAPEPEPVMAEGPAVQTPVFAPSSGNGKPATERIGTERFYSPLVKNIARQENIPLAELETVPGSGKEGRVTKKDILSYVEQRKTGVMPEMQPSMAPQPMEQVAAAPVGGGDEIIEMDRMRKIIADRMVQSKQTSPHVTSFVEADVTNIVIWRNRVKNEFKKREGDNLTFTPIFIEAVVKAIRDYPMINVQVDGTRIIKKKDINIGLAVALPTGNLIVPVIKNADQLNLLGLTKAVNDLSVRARNNQLNPDDLDGGTFTVSNVGSFGNVMGTPIIVQPQVAILALGAVVKKPSVIETPYGDTIGIRHKMFLSHSYDHRVVDGALGGMVVRRVADYLEKFDINRTI